MTVPRVSVLIVNFRSTDLLRRCLHAVEAAASREAAEVIVVDNASPEFDADEFRAAFPAVVFLPQESNTTYTNGNNIAASSASGEYVLLLNPDTVIAADAIAKAVKVLDAEPGLAGIAARLVNPDGSLQRYYRRLPTLRDLPAFLLPPVFGRTPRGRHYLMFDAPFDQPTKVGQPPGAFIFIRRASAPDPLLDPRYLNYCSDVALCRALWAKGSIEYRPEIVCIHERGGAGVRVADMNERLRLHHDLTWGARLYFAQDASFAGRIYLEFWLVLFWVIRVVQVLVTRPQYTLDAVRTAWRAMRGLRPAY